MLLIKETCAVICAGVKQKKEVSSIYALLLWLVPACFFDYRKDKIPNALILTGLLLACGYQAAQNSIGLLCVRILLVLILLYPLYMLGMLGAGDVKLYCMSAAFLAEKDCLIFFSFSLSLSAAAALLKMLFLGNLRERIHYFCLYVADVAKNGKLLFYQNGIVFEKKKSGLHMTGPMLLGFLLYLCVTH
ncbi:MAG: prepilin peptidase [Lachnospiraceae bacterium]|nr:prepilin peptidase [Lachnospiraceae bacterium]